MQRGLYFSGVVCGLLIAVLVWTAIADARSSRYARASSVNDMVSSSVPIAASGSKAAAHPSNLNGGKSSSTGQAAEDSQLPDGAHALDPALAIAYDALAKIEKNVDDYTAKLVKRERISGSLGSESTMQMKIRTPRKEGDKVVRPLHAYLKFENPWLSRGREVIWVDGRNDGKLIAHEGGLKNLVRVKLDPLDTLAMMGNKYPITEIGFTRLVEKLIEKGERDKLAGPCEVLIVDGEKVGDRACQLIQVTHPKPDPRFDFHIAQIFLDKELLIPLRYAAFMWPDKPGGPPVLEEEYTYLDVRINVGLTDADFDPDNPAYAFP